MASRVGLILRTTAARERIDSALVRIFETHDMGSLSPIPPQERDPEVKAMLREEWIADVLEGLAFGPPTDEEQFEPADDDFSETVGEETDEPRVEVPNDEPLEGDGDQEVALESDEGEQDPEDVTETDEEATDEDQEADAPEGSDEESESVEDLMSLSLADLKAHAIDQGADEDLVSKARSRKDVIAVMSADGEGK